MKSQLDTAHLCGAVRICKLWISGKRSLPLFLARLAAATHGSGLGGFSCQHLGIACFLSARKIKKNEKPPDERPPTFPGASRTLPAARTAAP